LSTWSIHANVKFSEDENPSKTVMEVDAVIDGGLFLVYFVEVSYSPHPAEVEVLKSKATRFLTLFVKSTYISGPLSPLLQFLLDGIGWKLPSKKQRFESEQ
jgi:hypothetical protein